MTFASHSSLVAAINERYLFNVPGVKEIWLIRHADAYSAESSGAHQELHDLLV